MGERICGYSAKEAVGPISVLVPPDRPDEIHDTLRHVREEETVSPHETVCLDKDGRRISVSATVSPIKDTVGRVMDDCVMSRDIPE